MNPIIFYDPLFQQWAFLQVPVAVVVMLLPMAYWWSWGVALPSGRFRFIVRVLNWQLVAVYVNWVVQLVGWSFFWDVAQHQKHESAQQVTLLTMQVYFGAFAVFIAYLYGRIGLRRALGMTKADFRLSRYARVKLALGVVAVYVPVYLHVMHRLIGG